MLLQRIFYAIKWVWSNSIKNLEEAFHFVHSNYYSMQRGQINLYLDILFDVVKLKSHSYKWFRKTLDIKEDTK